MEEEGPQTLLQAAGEHRTEREARRSPSSEAQRGGGGQQRRSGPRRGAERGGGTRSRERQVRLYAGARGAGSMAPTSCPRGSPEREVAEGKDALRPAKAEQMTNGVEKAICKASAELATGALGTLRGEGVGHGQTSPVHCLRQGEPRGAGGRAATSDCLGRRRSCRSPALPSSATRRELRPAPGRGSPALSQKRRSLAASSAALLGSGYK